MTPDNQYSILIIEPNKNMRSPYAYLSGLSSPSNITRLPSIHSGLAHLIENKPDIVFLSASYEMDRILVFLESLKNKSTDSLINLIIMIDFSQTLSQIPGTTWGDNIGIASNLTSAPELEAILSRIIGDNINLKTN